MHSLSLSLSLSLSVSLSLSLSFFFFFFLRNAELTKFLTFVFVCEYVCKRASMMLKLLFHFKKKQFCPEIQSNLFSFVNFILSVHMDVVIQKFSSIKSLI